MATLPESETYEASIYQLETNDAVLGGVNGPANKQGKQLANRTNWLKRRSEIVQENVDKAKQELQKAIDDILNNGAFVPTGATLFIIGNTPPKGYLKMNGAILSRAAYPALWAYAQNALAPNNDTYNYPGLFGSGNGSTTFQLPDTRGWFPRFWGEGNYPDSDSYRALGSVQQDAVGSHQHDYSRQQLTFMPNTNLPTSTAIEENAFNTPGWKIELLNYSTNYNNNNGAGFENRVRNIALVGVIKY